ncbi:MAG: DUF3842 family protein [Clostridiales bacterium]|nr:DUF3842 family protein [Clostridiales bacterium]
MANAKHILVIDGQGGQLGKEIIRGIRERFENAHIMAVGTNAMATAAMLKAGADQAATGENPVITACRKADIIIGPIGIVIADAFLGEVTAAMAAAVGRAEAVRLLVPMNRCDNIIAGVADTAMSFLVQDVMKKLAAILESTAC